MSSFIYIYSKFTEEFLLLGGAAIFSLSSLYGYHWVIKRRRLGAARSQVPSVVVKAYLNQLIQEAQSVRTQLFGLLGGELDPAKIQSFLTRIPSVGDSSASGPSAGPGSTSLADAIAPTTAILEGAVPTDLLERLKSLESQLTQKESLVVNINIEKTKLLEEIENLRQNQKALQNSQAVTAGQEELLKKIKNLEERLEEYSLFEEDLANLKRLQQENVALKKRLEDSGGAPANSLPVRESEPRVDSTAVVLEATPSPSASSSELGSKKAALDQNTIDSLLDGVSPVQPTLEATLGTTAPPSGPAALASVTPLPTPSESKPDAFEKLVDSVEDSLAKAPPPSSPTPSPTASSPVAASPNTTEATPAPQTASTQKPVTAADAVAAKASPPISEKSDEELLKEFENLLNS